MESLQLAASPLLIALCAALCGAATLPLLIRLAPTIGLMDAPAGRKDHDRPTPLVGGIAIMLALIVTSILLRLDMRLITLLVCGLLVFVAGVFDDLREISQYPRFAAQIIACCLVLWLLDTPLRSVGNLLGLGPIGLWVFALPMTVFAVVGVINAFNMSDGLDGLAGTQSLIATLAFAIAASLSGLTGHANFLIALAGALGAFLLFNLRLPWQPRARTFLGDAGSMTLGFILGWTAVELTQGLDRSFPPICALWIVVIPLCDTVSLVLRRRKAGRSPFDPDREHLHHQLLQRGYSVNQVVGIVAAASLLTSSVGLCGWLLGVPEPVLFVLFVGLFLWHHLYSKRFWARVNSQLGKSAARADDQVVLP